MCGDVHLNARYTCQCLTGSEPAKEIRKVDSPLRHFARTWATPVKWNLYMGEHNAYLSGNAVGMKADEIAALIDEKVTY